MNNKKLNKFLLTILFSFAFVFIFSLQAMAADKTELYFFWGDGCLYCANAKPFLEKLKSEYPNLDIKSYEIYNNQDNEKLFAALRDAHTEDIRGVPAFFIGRDAFAGYAESMDNYVRQLVENCLANNCESPIEKLNKKIAVASDNQSKNNINNTKSNFVKEAEQGGDLKFIFLSIFIVLVAVFIFLKRIKDSK